MVTDAAIAAEFVPAPDHWSRNGADIRAVVIHMAEGGGTVSWLTRDDGNSSHYVVEYSGRVVQMVRESEAAGSMNPRATREDDDAPYTFAGERITYGRTALDAARIASSPNRYAIAIEVEGFAAAGPNDDQVAALEDLVADIRRRHGDEVHVLGHRDQQGYKPCPGHRMPWSRFGGHGALTAPTEDPDMRTITTTVPKLIAWPDGTRYYELDGVTPAGTAAATTDRLSPFGCGTMRAFYRGDKQLALVVPTSIAELPAPTAVPDPAQLETANDAGWNDALVAASSAVSGIPRR